MIDDVLKARALALYEEYRNPQEKHAALREEVELALGLLRAQYKHVMEAVMESFSEAKIEPTFTDIIDLTESILIDKSAIIARTSELLGLSGRPRIDWEATFDMHEKDILIQAKLDTSSLLRTGKKWDLWWQPSSHATKAYEDMVKFLQEQDAALKEFGGEVLDDSNYGPPDHEEDYKVTIGDTSKP